MFGAIKEFETISRHEAKLRQSPVVIECLTAVLNYIKSVLTDDSTQELIDLVNTHIESKGAIHYVNLDLLNDQIIDTLQKTFIAIGLYTNDRVTENQFIDFFRDIYDGYERYDDVKLIQLHSEYDSGESIPFSTTAFVHWLIDNPQIYTDVLPEDYDSLKCGLSVKVADNLFSEHHDDQVEAHSETLAIRLDKLLTMCSVEPIHTITPIGFASSLYQIIDAESFSRLMVIVLDKLAELGNPLTIDFLTYVDIAGEVISYGFNQSLLIASDFFMQLYQMLDPNYQVTLIQYDIDSLEAFYYRGEGTMDGYRELLIACGETDDRIFKKKFTDYYSNHLTFVLSDSMTPEYRDTLTTLRGNVHTNYSKVYNVFTLLNQNNFSIALTISLSHLIQDKTLDIINVVGFTKSIACLSLIPTNDTNKLVIAYDNYNPAFTSTLIDNIAEGEIRHISIVISVSKSVINTFVELNDEYVKVSFANTDRMFDVFPFLLYAIPRVAEYSNGTNRINRIKLFAKALDDDDALATITGFNQ